MGSKRMAGAAAPPNQWDLYACKAGPRCRRARGARRARRIELAYWQVIAAAVLACNGGAWTDTACLVTSTRNFPGERGTVIGILKSCVGARPGGQGRVG
jgi:hypothetical protein